MILLLILFVFISRPHKPLIRAKPMVAKDYSIEINKYTFAGSGRFFPASLDLRYKLCRNNGPKGKPSWHPQGSNETIIKDHKVKE